MIKIFVIRVCITAANIINLIEIKSEKIIKEIKIKNKMLLLDIIYIVVIKIVHLLIY